MASLNDILNEQKIVQIHETINGFVHSADGYSNKLKLVFALMSIIDESLSLLRTVDCTNYIQEVRERIVQLSAEAESLAQAYHAHLTQNEEIYSILADTPSDRISNIERQVESLMQEYDGIIKGIVEEREKLPLECQLKEQGQ